MFETANSLSDRRLTLRTNSSTTLSSSLAAADIMQQYTHLSKSLSQKPVVDINKPKGMKFENNENIQIVYNHNYCSHGSSDELKQDLVSLSEEFRRDTKTSKCLKFLKKKNVASLVLIFVIGILSIITSVTTYYMMTHWDSKKSFDPDKTTLITTEPAITDPITTTKGITSTKPQTIEPDGNDTTTTYPETDPSTTTTETPSATTTEFEYLPEYLMSRDDWGAEPPTSANIKKLELPIKRIIIGHTSGNFCFDQNVCISTVKSLQTENSDLDDIPYNFLLGDDGRIYEGRGFEYQGQHTQNLYGTDYNSIGICIAFIGNYTTTKPRATQISLIKEFIRRFVANGTIVEDHIIVLQDDLKYFEVRANALNEEIKTFDNFRPLYRVYRREEWNADRPAYQNLSNAIITSIEITRFAPNPCTDMSDCADTLRRFQWDCKAQKIFSCSPDIDDHFIFGGNGLAFEGRGFDVSNIWIPRSSIWIGVIGDFESIPPNQEIINAILQVFDDAMVLGKISEDYEFSICDERYLGAAFVEIIKEWCRYVNSTTPCD